MTWKLLFFSCYLVVPSPAFSQCRGGSLTHLMVFESMHFQRFRPEVHLLGVSLVARNEQIFGQWGRTSLVAPQ